jgi:hypothetical protein
LNCDLEVFPMRMVRALRGVVLACGLTLGLLAAITGTALAAGTKVCVPTTEGTAIVTAKAGACAAGYTKSTLLAEAEQEKLEKVLPYINYEAEGVDKKPTIQFSGVNLQVIDGSGLETTVNGTGNLILGYDEGPGAQTGSHNLLLGGSGNSYTSYGGIVSGGFSNKISGPYASILGGAENISSGYASTITSGHSNTATANYSTISGGCSNLAGTGTPTINSGCTTSHPGYFASILGGAGNLASGQNSAISGGEKNTASAIDTSVTGGYGNKATGRWDSITGGYENLAGITEESNEFHGANSVDGGAFNEATGPGQSWIGSGEYGKASGSHSAIVGGYKSTASGTNATVGGGAEGASSGEDAAVLGGSKNKATTTDALAPEAEGGTSVLSKSEQEGLKPVLKYLKYTGSGVGGKPTVQIEGANLQVMSAGIPQRGNAGGTGNLVIGQNEEIEPREGSWEGIPVEASKQTGSDNLIIGDEQHFSSYYSLVGGFQNTDSAPNSDVLGIKDTASGEGSSVSGGYEGKATGLHSSISGGFAGTASGEDSSVSGGWESNASGQAASIAGGYESKATSTQSDVLGGYEGKATNKYAAVLGGYQNTASGEYSAVSGGGGGEAKGEMASVVGGRFGLAKGFASTIGGGLSELIEEEYGVRP